MTLRGSSINSSKSSGQRSPTIAELVSPACTLILLPALTIYLGVVIAVMTKQIDFAGELILVMILALTGLAIFAIAMVGLIATLLQYRRTRVLKGFHFWSLVLQGGVVAMTVLLACSGWQL